MPRWILVPPIGLLISFNTFVTVRAGFLSVFPPFPNLPMTQMFVDMAIALALVATWMVADTRRRGRPFLTVVPFLVATVLLGSLGPLLYLAFRHPRIEADGPPGTRD